MHKDGYQPEVSIIVPVHDQSEKTVKCFASIRAHTKTPYELIWVDNGSSPEHFGPIRRQAIRPRVHTKLVKLKTNTGFVKATNLGIKEVDKDCKYVILLNNDTEVSERWAAKLIQPLKDDPTIGAVGPVTQSGIAWQQARYLNLRWGLGVPTFTKRHKVARSINAYARTLDKMFGNKYVDVGRGPLSFFCVALRKETIDAVGMLDEDFGLGFGDDDEYCCRLSMCGYKLVLSLGTFVYHHHRTTFKALKLPVPTLQRRNTALLKRKKARLNGSSKKSSD